MSETIGDTIRSIYDAALDNDANPVLAVADYLTEKNDKRCTSEHAFEMITRHVIDYRRNQAASEYGPQATA